MCEYYDVRQGRVLNRNYIIYLQHKIRELEGDLEREIDHDLDATKKTENQAVDAAALVTPTAAGEQFFVVATSPQPQLTKEQLRIMSQRRKLV